MIISAPLTHVTPNPWQTRAGLDEVHIRDLAIDIAARKTSRPDTLGLLQLPAGRLIAPDGDLIHPTAPDQVAHYLGAGCTIQLAYGHNRAAAFRLLAQGDDDAFTPDPDYANLPLSLVQFTDEEMATSAWSENAARKDLTSIEEAAAIQRMIDSFNWTQTQIAERLGLDRSTVANKLRLLRLPGDVQVALQDRQLSERQAIALMPLLNLPAPAQAKADTHWGIKPQELLESALNEGISSERIRDRADTIIQQSTISFAQGRGGRGCPWPLDHWFEVDDEQATRLQQHTCSDCTIRVKHNNEMRCPDETCWDLKAKLWADARLTEAEAASGLPRLDLPFSNRYGITESFYRGEDAPLIAQILSEGCPNNHLHIEHDPGSPAGARLPGFDDVRVVCHHSEGGHCTCLASKKAARTRERNTNDPDLQAQRQREQRVRELTEPAFQSLADALLAGHLGVWRLLLKRINHAYAGKGQDWDLQKLALKVAGELLTDLQWQKDNPDAAQSTIIRAFEDAGLDLPWPPPDPIKQLQHRFDRVLKWFDRCRQHVPSIEELSGNKHNLYKLATELADLPPSDHKDSLAAQVAQRREQLNAIARSLADWSDDDAPQWSQHASWLITVPPDDVNFQGHLEKVTHPVILNYIIALVEREPKQVTRIKYLTRRLRQLAQTERKSHRQLAAELDVPINAIAIVRETLSGTSADARRTLNVHPDPVAAAYRLAELRNCDDDTQNAITADLLASIRLADDDAQTYTVLPNTQEQS